MCCNYWFKKRSHNFFIGISSLTLFLLILIQESKAQCEELYELRSKKEDLTSQLEGLSSALPFVEKFEQVKLSIEELKEALSNTSKDLVEVKEKVDDLLSITRAQNEEMRNIKTWARSVYSNPDWEPKAKPTGNEIITVSKGLENAKDWIDDLEADLEKFNQFMNVLEGGVRASEGHPSEQLKEFEKYFNSIRRTIDKYADKVPLINIFSIFFRFYETSIGLIAISAERIENEYNKRDEILKELGPEFNNVRYNWPQTTPSERLTRQRNSLQNEIENVDKRIEVLLKDCSDRNGNSSPDSDEVNFLENEMGRARTAAERRCAMQYNISGEDELVNDRNRLLEKVKITYPRSRFWPSEYGNSLNAAEEIDWIEKRHLDRKYALITAAQLEFAKLQLELDSLESRYQQFRNGSITLSTREQEKLVVGRIDKQILHRWKSQRMKEDSTRLAIADADIKELLELQNRLCDFQKCVKDWMEGLANQMKWDKYWLIYFNKDLYKQTLVNTFRIIHVNFPKLINTPEDGSWTPLIPIEIYWSGNVEFPITLNWINVHSSIEGEFENAFMLIREESNPIIIPQFYKFKKKSTNKISMVYELRLQESKINDYKTARPFQVRFTMH